MSRKVVIIGGVAGGMSAATRLRRLDPNAEIVVLERSGYVSYANCGLPYYMGGVIENESSLLLQTPESLNQRFRLDVRVNTEVHKIDRDAKKVFATNLVTGENSKFSYDALILSPGASAVRPPLPGIERAMTLRTVEDVQRLTERVKSKPKSAVVIGGGFIGVEAAENLRHQGIPTVLVEAMDQVLAPLDPEMASLVEEEMRRNGVELHVGAAVKAIGESSVELNDGSVIDGDLVLLAIGVRPETSLATAAGLKIGARNGIAVNEFNQTSDPSIYAIGDAAEKIDALTGEETLIPLANIANRQGRVIADHILGRPIRTQGSLGTAIVKVFDLTIAVVGWNEKRLKAAGRAYHAIHTHPGSHAGYYPGAQTMALKLLISPEGEILGAQGIGKEGVDKRIDVIATAMKGKLNAVELSDLELAYAPPFGSAKDAVNMLGYVAENILTNTSPSVQWHEVPELVDAGAVLIDVRTVGEFSRGHIKGSLNIPVDELRERINEVPTNRPLIVTCAVGVRGHTATMLLRGLGRDARNLDGGWTTWNAAAMKALVPAS